MKTNLLLLIILFTTLTGIIPVNATENYLRIIKKDDNTQVQEYHYDLTYTLGQANLQIHGDNDIAYVMLRDENRFVNPTNGKTITDIIARALMDKTAIQPDTYTFEKSNISELEIEFTGYGNNTIGLSDAEKAQTVKDGDINYLWQDTIGNTKICSLLLIKNDDTYQRLDFSINPEFFTGEALLFDDERLSEYNNQQKALAFLYSVLDFHADFKNSSEAYYTGVMNDNAWDMFKDMDNSLIYTPEQKASFITKMIKHFTATIDTVQDPHEGSELLLPYLSTDNGHYNFVYESKRNPYIEAYLNFLFFIDKPIYSAFYQAKDSITYDYAQYDKISMDDGEEIARRALRYLTWGVEYTPYVSDTIETGYSDNFVYNKYREDYIEPWLDNTSIGSQDDNYAQSYRTIYDLSGSNNSNQTRSNTLHTVHNIKKSMNTNKLRIIADIKNKPNFGITKIDLFSSTNLAWEEGVISGYIAKPEGTALNASALNDKKIQVNDSPENCILTKGDGASVAFGYVFNNPMTIGGLVIIVDQSGDQASNALNCDTNNFNTFSIKYVKDDPDIPLAIGDDDNYREFSTDIYGEKGATKEYYNTSRKPGRALAKRKVFGRNGKFCTYIYISFNPINDCRQIFVESAYDHKTTNIAEFMVFPSAPLSYIPNDDAVYINDIVYPFSISGDGTWSDENEPAMSADYRILFNNKFDTYFNPYPADYLELTIPLKNVQNIESCVIWERDHATNEVSVLDQEILLTTLDSNILQAGEYISARELESHLDRNDLTSPYIKEANYSPYSHGVRGNPLPYAPGGIDSPRIFAYKMDQQLKAREVTKDVEHNDSTTLALDETGRYDYKTGYVNEPDVYNRYSQNEALTLNGCYYDESSTERLKQNIPAYNDQQAIKPYLPGFQVNNAEGCITRFGSPYQVDKIAGVDSIGILTGSIAQYGALADKILSAFNDPVPAILDRYNQMNKTPYNLGDKQYAIKGIDSNGKPVFYGVEENSYLDSLYRFTRTDIERNTVLVPDIKMIQKGDLIVNYNKDNEIHVGIVVGFRTDSHNITSMREVIVISVKRGLTMVTLGTWGNFEGRFGGFTDDPENYHIRRLIKLRPDGVITEDNAEPWEIINSRVMTLECDIVKVLDEASEIYHWLGNTDDDIQDGIYYNDYHFKLISKDITGALVEAGEIKILPPRDMYFNSLGIDGNNNIYTNKGSGIEIYVQGPEEWELFVKFQRIEANDGETEEITEDTYYTIIETNYINTDGTAKEGYEFVIKDDCLTLKHNNSVISNQFRVKAHGNIRPGDDFRLRFGLVDNPAVTGIVPENDFFACFDKKMLWRANLYIDDRNKPDGDWNDLHPWNSPDNEWNRFYDGQSFLTQGNAATILETLGEGDGRQVVTFNPFTYIKSCCGNDKGKSDSHAVAYTMTGGDTPFDYNNKMYQQMKILDHLYKNNVSIYTVLDEYNTTIAPANNEIQLSDVIDVEQRYRFDNYRYPVPVIGENVNGTINYIDVLDGGEERMYFPYLPGWSLQRYEDTVKKDPKYWEIKISAGVDCVGFVQGAASYVGNRYSWNDLHYTEGNKKGLSKQHIDADYSDLINRTRCHPKVAKNCSYMIFDSEGVDGVPANLNKIIPGDIVMYPNHVMMVQNITYSGNTRDAVADNITFIEATFGRTYAKVKNTRTLTDIRDKEWYVVRLIVE